MKNIHELCEHYTIDCIALDCKGCEHNTIVCIANKFDTGKLRYDLIPPEALEELTTILTYGANKYGDRNWEKGLKYTRVFAAIMRHLWAWFSGQDTDEESGHKHLAHAMCGIAFLIAYTRRGKDVELDDREKHATRH